MSAVRSARRGGRRGRLLVVAGLDPSGGAGLAADAEAAQAFGVPAWLVAAALTAQGGGGARGWWPVECDVVVAQVDALVGAPRGKRERHAPVGDGAEALAVKTGMIGTAENAAALAARLGEKPFARVPLVVDPVLAASSGLALVAGDAPRAAFEPLLARATLATPNWHELGVLAGVSVDTEDEAIRAARALPAKAVLVKGGHREGAPIDLLVEARRVTRFGGARIAGTARGTGCRLASAIAAQLAAGVGLPEAVARAKRYVARYIRAQSASRHPSSY